MQQDSGARSTKMSAEEVTVYLDEVFPERHDSGPAIAIEDVWPMGARLRLKFEDRLLRPGGTIHGPAMFMLADLGIYVAILAALGPVPLAVTTNLSINFLRRPSPRDMIGEVKLMKLGRRLAVGEVGLYSAGDDDPAANAVATYSIPPQE